jgi:hypothetical protein
MNYRLSLGLVALSASLVVGSSALAAPSVVYKKRLDVPAIPSTIISKIAAMGWQHPTTSSTPNGLATFKNVVMAKPAIADIQECGDIMYRMWEVSIDIKETQKTQPTITFIDKPYLSYGTRYVFEARTKTSVKWHIDEMYRGIYDNDHPAPKQFFGCKGKDVVVRYSPTTYHNMFAVYEAPGETVYKAISLAHFSSDAAWKTTLPSLGKRLYIRDYTKPIVIDGILQDPGQLYAGRDDASIPGVAGDSRIVSADKTHGTQVHHVPRYRDLLAIAPDERFLTATFYRTQDGYAVKEEALMYGGDGPIYRTNYYRIRNGEAQYTKVDSLPFTETNELIQNDRGLTLTKDMYAPKILVHGLSADSHSARGSVIWETDAQAYVHYTITEIMTGKQQYWEATVNKK